MEIKNTLGKIESLCLLSFSAYIIYLIRSGNYYYYLNVNSIPLSIITAGLLGILGLNNLFNRHSTGSWLRVVLFVSILLLGFLIPARIIGVEDLLQTPF